MKKETVVKATRELSEAQLKMIESLDGRPNTDDIPEAPAANWKHAQRGAIFKVRKVSISLRLDADVLAWLKDSTDRYQSAINSILRERMDQEARG